MKIHDWQTMFGAGRTLLAPDGDGASSGDGSVTVDVSDLGSGRPEPFTAAQQAEVNRIAAKARAQGRGERGGAPARDDDGKFQAPDKEAKRAARDERLATTVAQAVAAALKPPTAEQPRAVTAPSVPNKVDPFTSQGLVDIFALTPGQIDQLGPQGMRAELEKAVQVGRNLSGAPKAPKPGAGRR